MLALRVYGFPKVGFFLYRFIPQLTVTTDSAPNDVESMVEDLEESEDPKATLKTITSVNAAWMAQSLNAKILRQHEDMSGEITKELEVRFILYLTMFVLYLIRTTFPREMYAPVVFY